MINLTKKSLPNTIQVQGRDFPVYTDYRIWMRFCIEFQQWKNAMCRGILDISYLFSGELPAFYCVEDYAGILDFAFPSCKVPNGSGDGEQTLYYEYDGDYIYAAFMQNYGMDLLEEKLHWHKFIALLKGLSGTTLNEIMGYRAYTGTKQEKPEQQYQKLKYAWTPIPEETEEEKQAEEEFNRYFEC